MELQLQLQLKLDFCIWCAHGLGINHPTINWVFRNVFTFFAFQISFGIFYPPTIFHHFLTDCCLFFSPCMIINPFGIELINQFPVCICKMQASAQRTIVAFGFGRKNTVFAARIEIGLFKPANATIFISIHSFTICAH